MYKQDPEKDKKPQQDLVRKELLLSSHLLLGVLKKELANLQLANLRLLP